ncbi:hypothetical protein GPALN_005002 [Globodera pallida]|nr:hypothetical protein GPALN_005002 [Globodera pallida]
MRRSRPAAFASIHKTTSGGNENTSSSSSSTSPSSSSSCTLPADESTVDGSTVSASGGYGSADKPRKRSRVREVNSAEQNSNNDGIGTNESPPAAAGCAEGGERSKSLLIAVGAPRMCPEG